MPIEEIDLKDIEVNRYKIETIDGKKESRPIYDNYCLHCNASSIDVINLKDKLLKCSKCNHIQTIEDNEKRINDYWKNKKPE